ncbi:hypothetical protein P7C71_g1366, partial [Lecanoromycetidae sp. Uapishka_2]
MLALALTADMTGVTDLLPLDTADEPYFYTFRVQCTSCRETHPNWVSGEWMARGLESPANFSGIDLQEGEWFDYDEKAGEEVSIKDLKWEIVRA